MCHMYDVPVYHAKAHKTGNAQVLQYNCGNAAWNTVQHILSLTLSVTHTHTQIMREGQPQAHFCFLIKLFYLTD